MKISTRGRYALRVVVDLAEHINQGKIPLKDIAKRQNISLKYLESIMSDLSKSGVVVAQNGKGGGYILANSPEQCRVSDVLLSTERDLAPVACLESNAGPCAIASTCKTVEMWKKLYKMTMDFFDNITISDLVKTQTNDFDYVI